MADRWLIWGGRIFGRAGAEDDAAATRDPTRCAPQLRTPKRTGGNCLRGAPFRHIIARTKLSPAVRTIRVGGVDFAAGDDAMRRSFVPAPFSNGLMDRQQW